MTSRSAGCSQFRSRSGYSQSKCEKCRCESASRTPSPISTPSAGSSWYGTSFVAISRHIGTRGSFSRRILAESTSVVAAQRINDRSYVQSAASAYSGDRVSGRCRSPSGPVKRKCR